METVRTDVVVVGGGLVGLSLGHALASAGIGIEVMDVRAAVAHAAGAPLTVETVQLEGPRVGEVLVEIRATGICHTDYYTLSGADPEGIFPSILGHEGAGIVEAIGSDVRKVKVGDHVVMSFNSCGCCPSCRDDEPAYCHEFFPRNFFAAREDGTSGLSKGFFVVLQRYM